MSGRRRWLGLVALTLGVAKIIVDATIVKSMSAHGGLLSLQRPQALVVWASVRDRRRARLRRRR